VERRGRGGAYERAADDLRAGRLAIARERLKGYLVEVPWSLPARELLAQAQRIDGHPEEAGRWGFLVQGASRSSERAAFESTSRYRHQWAPGPGFVATNMLTALRWPAGLAAGDAHADAALAELDNRAAGEAEAAARRRYIPWHRRLRARLTGEEPIKFSVPGPPPRRAPHHGAHLALADDEHLARLLTDLRAQQTGLTSRQLRPAELLAHLHTAAEALDGSQLEWHELIGKLDDDLDQVLHRYHPVPAEEESWAAAHAALNVLDRAASPVR